jgi:NAD(P)-dependent dehydrogenase (short-subunit alcohol dehydrogenase family)
VAVTLDGRTIAVTGAGSTLADGLAAALVAAGANVLAGLDRVSTTLDGVVHAAMAATAYERVPFHEVDDERWDAVWEQSMRDAIAVLQAGYRAMRDRGGAFVVVTPVVGMSGAPELGPYSAAVEGVRLLAKSAARQWGADGIRVNCLAPAPEHVPIGVGSSVLALSPPALGGPGDVEADLGPIVAWLLSDDAHFLTGVTLCADGGVWMAP